MATATRRKPAYFKGVGKQVAHFAETRIQQTKGRWANKPLVLESWQVDLLDELYLVDDLGKRVYREALIGLPRKNGKSTLAAVIALHALIAAGEQGPEVFCAAASADQARIVFQQAREFVEASPALRTWLTPQRNAIICPANNGVFRVLSSDAPLQHGLNPSAVVIDELHAHKDPELYFALTTGVLAREEPLIVSITTAGYDRDTICWDVYDRGRALHAKGAKAMRKAGFLFYWRAAQPDAKVHSRKAWMDANPSSWINTEVIGREYDRLPEAVFRRLHLNQWTEAEESWIKPDDWDACVGRPRIYADQPIWAALDVGLSRDSSVVVLAQWHGDVLNVKAEIRTPSPTKPLSVTENRQRVREIAGQYEQLREFAFDPWAFRESAEILSDERIPMVKFDQTAAMMCPASERLHEIVRERRLVHNGDAQFRHQVLAAVAAQTERGWRISKRQSRERIDAAVALAMAADRAIASRTEPRLDISDYRITSL